MAFMMPVVKNNYTLYGNQPQQKKPASSSETDGRRVLAPCNSSVSVRRKTKSEGPSLSTSPAVVGGGDALAAAMRGTHAGKMRRTRGSAPTLAPSAPIALLYRQNSMPGGPNTAPNRHSPCPVSPTKSTGSSDSGSSETPSPTGGRFHIKLVARLKKSLRLKDSSSSASSTPTHRESPATATATSS